MYKIYNIVEICVVIMYIVICSTYYMLFSSVFTFKSLLIKKIIETF